MEEDFLGFSYPIVDMNKCIRCGLCLTACHLNHQFHAEIAQEAFAVINKDREALRASASGGVFSAIASTVIDKGGFVVGCSFTSEMIPQHKIITSKQELPSLRGSKYVESNLDSVYLSVEHHLKQGKQVLFVGTGCQVAGLKTYLRKYYDNLLTIDIICHGVPSREFFAESINNIEIKEKSSVVDFVFRSKEKNNWGGYNYSYRCANRTKKILPAYLDVYYSSFLKGISYRDSCYDCKYANLNRPSDLTIGDYWGVKKYHADLDARDGVSIVIVNTQKGRDILIKNDENLKIIKTELSWAMEKNTNLSHPTVIPKERDKFSLVVNQKGYAEYIRSEKKSWYYIKLHIKYLIPHSIKEPIKNGISLIREKFSKKGLILL